MEKKEIKQILREKSGIKKHYNAVTHAKDTTEASAENASDKIKSLLGNDIINHAAIVRKMTGADWDGNSEATNRSKFRKKLNNLANDEGYNYSFDEDEIKQIEKILMSTASSISNTIGRQGK